VNIQNEGSAGGLDLPGQRDGGFQRVVGSIAHRRYEDADAEGIPAMMVQDGEFIAGLAFFLIGGQMATAG